MMDGDEVNTKDIPAMISKILTRDPNEEGFDKRFN